MQQSEGGSNPVVISTYYNYISPQLSNVISHDDNILLKQMKERLEMFKKEIDLSIKGDIPLMHSSFKKTFYEQLEKLLNQVAYFQDKKFRDKKVKSIYRWFNENLQFYQKITSIKCDENIIPKEIKLNQNYPNPFNPSTAISYQLSAFSNVKLLIYNLLGQRIKTLVDSYQNAGEHSIVWDTTDDSNNPVSSGIYFYQLKTNGLVKQKKMLLIR